MDKEGKGQVGTPQKSVFHQQHPAAARSTGHIGEIQGTSDLRKERMLPACHVQPENEQLPQGNRRFLRHKEKSDQHVARHTFGTTVTLANNVPLQDVSVMLGHASTRMTQHYARVMNSSLKEAMNNVKERLEW